MGAPRTTLRSPVLQEHFDRLGSAVVDLLDRPTADALRDRILDLHEGLRSGMRPSIESDDLGYRRRAHEAIVAAVREPLELVLVDHEILYASLLVKWPGDGATDPHQDWTFVDETAFRSATVWCPLVDVDTTSGALQVVPGSHRRSAHVRCAPSLPDGYDDPSAEIGADDLAVCEMRAGQALVFDHALVHGATPNSGTEPRVVIAAAVAPVEADVTHYRRDDAGRLWAFDAPDVDWFLQLDFANGPAVEPDRGPIAFEAPSPATPPRRRATLVDPDLEQHFVDDGYVVVDLLDRATVDALRSGYERLEPVDVGPSPFAEGFHTTIYDPRPDYRADISALVDQHVAPALERLLVDHAIFWASFAVKHPNGHAVPAHLDWSFLDETTASSATVWCALTDTTADAGALGVFPGSHRRVDFVRPVNHRDYERHAAVTAAGVRPVTLALLPGQAVVMDNRTVHFSAPNATESTRVSAAVVVAPRDAPLHHYWVDPGGRVVRFDLEPEFYLHYRIGEDPAGVRGVTGQRLLEDVSYG